MFDEVVSQAFDMKPGESVWKEFSRAFLGVVHDNELWFVDDTKPGFPDSQAVIDIFWGIEDRFVEQADSIEGFAGQEPASGDRVIDIGGIDLDLCFFDLSQTNYTFDFSRDGGELIGRELRATVGENQFRGDEADFRMLIEVVDQPAEGFR